MTKFKILQFADLHMHRENIDEARAALDAVCGLAEDAEDASGSPVDLAVFCGDISKRRGHLYPPVAYHVRRAFEIIAGATCQGMVAVDGNHDPTDFTAEQTPDGAMRAAHESATVAILGAEDPTASETGKIAIVSGAPAVLNYDAVTVVAIPCFDKYMIDAIRADGIEAPEGIVRAVIQGKIGEARAVGAKRIVVVYHGTISGATLDNEQVVRAGIDVPVPADAFAGADLVLLGHLHRAQSVAGPCPIFYSGAMVPLTWNDRAMEPCAMIHEINLETGGIYTSRIRLPVLSQMIEIAVDADSVAGVVGAVAGAPPNSRVRLKVTGPGAALDQITATVEEQIISMNSLKSLSIIKTRTDQVTARVDADRDIRIEDAVGLWYDLRPGADPADVQRARLLEYAEAVEQKIADENLDARFDFRPITLRVVNFCQYGEAEIDFDSIEGITAIRGANTSGKSNLVRAIPFALFKAQLSGDVMADLIRNGTDQASVELIFDSGADRYRIRRILKRGSGRDAKSSLFFDQWTNVVDAVGAGWIPAFGSDARETQSVIESLVGPADLFFATVYADQNAIDALLDLRPAEFKDTVAGVFHRDFAGRVQIARDARRDLKKKIDRLRIVIEENAVDPKAIQDARDAIQAADLDITAGRDDVGRLNRQRDLAAEQVADLNARIAAVDKAAAALLDLNARLSETLAAIGIQDQVVALATDAADKMVAADLAVVDLRKNAEVVDGLIIEAEAVSAELMAAREAYNKAAIHQTNLRQGITAKVVEAERDEQVAEHGLKTAQHARDVATKAADLIDRVPCEGGVWTDNSMEMDGGACPLLTNAIEARNSLARLSLAVDTAAEVFSGWSATADQFRADLVNFDLATQSPDSALNAAKTALAAVEQRAKDADVVGLKIRRDKIARDRMTAGAELARLAERAGRLEGAQNERRRLQDVADGLAGQISAAALAVDLDALKAEQVAAVIRVRDAEDFKAGAEIRVREAERRQAQAEQSIQHFLDRTAKATAAEAMAGNMIADDAVFGLYEDALDRDGVPFLLLERFAVPGLRDRVNAYLAPTGFRVDIATERTSVTAGVKTGVYITFDDSRGSHPVTAASGFQRMALGAAIRCAMADLHSQSTGTRLSLNVQDEGFGAYDSENIQGAIQTIRTIAAGRRFFLFVSHVEAMSDAADQILNVASGPNGSTVSDPAGS